MTVDTIVFDIGNVLIEWDPHIPYIEAFGSEEKARWFIRNICNHDWNVQMDAGKSFDQAVKVAVRCAANHGHVDVTQLERSRGES